MSDYAHPDDVVMIRFYTEETPGRGDEWFIDGVDAEGHYTEACWSFDTEEEAAAAIPEFCQNHRINADLPVGPGHQHDAMQHDDCKECGTWWGGDD